MKLNLIPCSFASLVPMVAMVAPAVAAEGWMTDLPAALAKAAAENKHVLVDFTGSDWCSACIMLHRNVLDTPDFRAYTADKFVLVEVDLPQRKSFDAALRKKNEAIAARYGIAGYPTILVLNPQGKVLGGFQDGNKTVKESIELLENARVADALLRRAAMQSGTERARTLYRVYLSFPDSKGFAAPREALRNEIMKADPQNVTGIHEAAAVQEQAKRFLAQRAPLAINSPAMGKLLEQQLREALPANRPEVMLERCHYALATAETLEDIDAAHKLFLEVIPLLPADKAKQIKEFVDTYFTVPEALLKMLKASRPG
ncbi:MAG: thioredoxin family protein [Akkermansia sp.]|nr:thioredoxin family protein [Akkermansia sp.]